MMCVAAYFGNRMRFKCMLDYNRHRIKHSLLILSSTAY